MIRLSRLTQSIATEPVVEDRESDAPGDRCADARLLVRGEHSTKPLADGSAEPDPGKYKGIRACATRRKEPCGTLPRCQRQSCVGE
jgi:hypothetical protein